MSAIIASAAIGAVGAGYKVFQGISQNSAANKLQRGLVRPMYKIQDQYYQNQGLAENAAQSGLGASSLNYYGDQTNRGLASGISGVLQGGGDVNSINALYDKFNQGNRAVSAEDARLKTDNIRYLVDRNKDLAGQETQQWALNKYEPYKDTATAISGLRNAGSQNVSTGISEFGSTLSTLNSDLNPEDISKKTPNPNNIITNPTITDMNRTSNQFGTPDPFNTKGGLVVPGSAIDPNVVNGIATTNVLKQYQNSPYYEQLSAYLNQAVA
jgi:hypothetical protein